MQITTQNQYNTSYKGGLKSLNALNPVSYYANRYFKRSAQISNKNLTPISDSLADKIKQIKQDRILAWDINPENSKDYVFFLHGMSQKIKKVNTPTYILQSENDSVTLLNGAKKLVKTAQEKGILKDFTILPTGRHKVDSKKVDALNKILGEI